MGTTPRGLTYPEPTDLVTDGATAIRALAEGVDARLPATLVDAAGDLLVGTGPDAVGRLGAGTLGQVLTVGAAGGPEWQSASDALLLKFDAAGDLLVGTGPDTAGRLAAGAVGDVLSVTADGQLGWRSAGQVLARGIAQPAGTFVQKGTSSTAFVAVGEPLLELTVRVPPSGRLLWRVVGHLGYGGQYSWLGVKPGAGAVAFAARQYGQLPTVGAALLTGLTAGTDVALIPQFRSGSSSATVFFSYGETEFGAATVEVIAL